MMKMKHNLKFKNFIQSLFFVYLIGFIVSAVCIGLYFCDCINCNWQNIFMSAGASLIGAIVLAACIDLHNRKSRKRQFFVANIELYRLLNILFFRYYDSINNVYYKLYQEFDYKKINDKVDIINLLKIFSQIGEDLKNKTAPVLSDGENDFNDYRSYNEAVVELRKYDEEFIKKRKEFSVLKERFDLSKPSLLSSGLMTENEMFMLDSLYSIFCYQEPSDTAISFRQAEIIELGKDFAEMAEIFPPQFFSKLGFKCKYHTPNGYLMQEI